MGGTQQIVLSESDVLSNLRRVDSSETHDELDSAFGILASDINVQLCPRLGGHDLDYNDLNHEHILMGINQADSIFDDLYHKYEVHAENTRVKHCGTTYSGRDARRRGFNENYKALVENNCVYKADESSLKGEGLGFLLRVNPADLYTDSLDVRFDHFRKLEGLSDSRPFKNNLASFISDTELSGSYLVVACNSSILFFPSNLITPQARQPVFRFDSRPLHTSPSDSQVAVSPSDPYSINFLTSRSSWMGEGILAACTDDGRILVWKTKDLCKKIAQNESVQRGYTSYYGLRVRADIELIVGCSCWSVDFGSVMDDFGEEHFIVAGSSNSHTVTLFYYNSNTGSFRRFDSTSLEHNIPEVSIMSYDIVDSLHEVTSALLRGDSLLCTALTDVLFDFDEVKSQQNLSWSDRISLTIIIPELSAFIMATQAGLVTIMRLCQYNNHQAMRQEYIIPNYPSLNSRGATIIGMASKDISVSLSYPRILLTIIYADGAKGVLRDEHNMEDIDEFFAEANSTSGSSNVSGILAPWTSLSGGSKMNPGSSVTFTDIKSKHSSMKSNVSGNGLGAKASDVPTASTSTSPMTHIYESAPINDGSNSPLAHTDDFQDLTFEDIENSKFSTSDQDLGNDSQGGKDDDSSGDEDFEFPNDEFLDDEQTGVTSSLPSPPPESRKLRRSKRTRVKPLDYWRNERIIYSRADEDYSHDKETTLINDLKKIPLQEIDQIIHVEDPIKNHKKRKASRKHVKRKQTVTSDGEDYNPEWFSEGAKMIDVFMKDESVARQEVAWAPDGVPFEETREQEGGMAELFQAAPLYRSPTGSISTGLIDMPLNGFKSLRSANDMICIFHVSEGRIGLLFYVAAHL
ncbi:hypothetical protein CXQ85_003077 [Candidozyma haemuli]|uniref:Uncharacterized protein n=1 Tax=Candidozyma haemuli TaxID=45357 RepID=A0A2V1B0X6_9ASCO|nr:hypothetical protein CXQ85_003077 [[Candida] haemuloni]PVH23343.1 hypothetical protein CXQ85_003077 [[Candida] haemuloni]